MMDVKKLLGGMTKDITDVSKCKGGCHTSPREKRCRNSCVVENRKVLVDKIDLTPL